MVSGDPVNVAARLQQHAQPGEILVGERTWSVTRRTISYGAPREVDAKGKPVPVRAWATAGAADDPSPADIAGLTAPLIGRESELAVLTAVCSRVAREPVPQLVMLYGQAGVGKSRLLDELLGRLEGARVLEGRCLRTVREARTGPCRGSEGTRRDPGTDPNDVAAEKLRGAIEPLLPAERAAGVLEAIAWTIGLSLSGTSTIASDAREAVRPWHSAWAEYLGALGRKSLVVLVLEDVHWASAALLDLVDYLAEPVSDTRLLLVCSARPELLERAPRGAPASRMSPRSPSGRSLPSIRPGSWPRCSARRSWRERSAIVSWQPPRATRSSSRRCCTCWWSRAHSSAATVTGSPPSGSPRSRFRIRCTAPSLRASTCSRRRRGKRCAGAPSSAACSGPRPSTSTKPSSPRSAGGASSPTGRNP